MRSAGRSDFVRVLPWVLCLALGASAHLLWALDAWWKPAPRLSVAPVIVQVTPPPPTVTRTIVVREAVPHVRRTETPAASDPELLRMLVDAHVRCDADTCTIDPRLVNYLLADRRRRDHLVFDVARDGDPRELTLRLDRLQAPRSPRRGPPHSTGRRTAVTRDGRPRAIATSASP